MKPYYYTEENLLFRTNTDGTQTFFPFIKGETYEKYKTSPEFMQTLENAFRVYGQRVKNEKSQLISLSGETKPVTIKGRGTYQIPVEIFNKILDASKIAGIDPRQGLAIAIAESGGGTDSNRKNSYYRMSYGNGHSSGFHSPNQIGPATIVSNWQYFDNSPYIGLLRGWERSGWDVDKVSEDAKYQQKRYQSKYDDFEKNLNEDILVNMFKLPLQSINPGNKNYTSIIKQYMNNMSYKNGGTLFKK